MGELIDADTDFEDTIRNAMNAEGALDGIQDTVREQLSGDNFTKIGIESGEITMSEVDGVKVIKYGDSVLDTTKLDEFRKNIEDGKIADAYRAIGMPESFFDEGGPFAEYAKETSVEVATDAGNQIINSVQGDEGAEVRGERARGDDPKNPTTDAENAKVEDNPNIKKAKGDLVKEADDAKKEGKTTVDKGKWVERAFDLAKLAALGTGIGLLVKAIKDHQKAMNGCWLVENSSGNKYKVRMLTCESGERGSNCCGSWGDIPGNSKGVATCAVHAKCCDYNSDPSNKDAAIICQKYRIDKTGKVIMSTDGKTPLCKQCVGQCDENTSCSSLCDCSKVANCPAGTRLVCMNVDFWGAAGDFLGDAFGGLVGGFLKGLWRVAKWIILAIGIVILAVVAWKVITFIISETRKKKSGFGRRRPPRLK